MKKIFCCALISLLANVSYAESEWSLDSCMENMIRKFVCSVNNEPVVVDLESEETQTVLLASENSLEDKILGIYILNVKGGNLYVSCDDSYSLEQVKHRLSSGEEKKVNCIPLD